LVRVKDNTGNEFGPAFDKNNNIISNNEIINSNGYLTSYSYDKDNRGTGTTYSRIKLPNGKGEVFPLNGSGIGTKGMNSSANPAFVKEDGKMVLSAAANTNALYKLGLNKKSGTFALWFKTKETNTTRYIMATDGNWSNQMLNMYIDTDNKLHIGVRDSATNWVVLASSSDTISPNTWYYAAVSWKFNI
jgi:hypothetical protein